MLEAIQKLDAYQNLISDLQSGKTQSSVGLSRSVRLPMTSAFSRSLNWPIVYVVERMDQAISLADELSFWIDHDQIQLFPEPTPMFYMNSTPLPTSNVCEIPNTQVRNSLIFLVWFYSGFQGS